MKATFLEGKRVIKAHASTMSFLVETSAEHTPQLQCPPCPDCTLTLPAHCIGAAPTNPTIVNSPLLIKGTVKSASIRNSPSIFCMYSILLRPNPKRSCQPGGAGGNWHPHSQDMPNVEQSYALQGPRPDAPPPPPSSYSWARPCLMPLPLIVGPPTRVRSLVVLGPWPSSSLLPATPLLLIHNAPCRTPGLVVSSGLTFRMRLSRTLCF